MRRSWDDIRQKTCGLVIRCQYDRLMVRRMPRRRQHTNAGDDLGWAFHKSEAAGFVHGIEVVRQITRAHTLVTIMRPFPLTALHNVFGVRKRHANLAVLIFYGVAARVIEMQMRVDDNIDVAWGVAGGAYGVFQLRG